MGYLRTIWHEVFGLFVDDGRFAVAILGWVAIAAFLAPRLGAGPRWNGFVLFAGLALILVVGAVLATRGNTANKSAGPNRPPTV